jgi:hypothetical protein
VDSRRGSSASLFLNEERDAVGRGGTEIANGLRILVGIKVRPHLLPRCDLEQAELGAETILLVAQVTQLPRPGYTRGPVPVK